MSGVKSCLWSVGHSEERRVTARELSCVTYDPSNWTRGRKSNLRRKGSHFYQKLRKARKTGVVRKRGEEKRDSSEIFWREEEEEGVFIGFGE